VQNHPQTSSGEILSAASENKNSDGKSTTVQLKDALIGTFDELYSTFA
jgi:hypothetical protein